MLSSGLLRQQERCCSGFLLRGFLSRPYRRMIGAGLSSVTVALVIWCLCRQVAYRRGFPIYPESNTRLFEDVCLQNPIGEIGNVKDYQTTLKYYFLLALVISRPNATERRLAIRRSWIQGNKELLQKEKVLVLFSVGTTNLSTYEIGELNKEQRKYGDILMLEDSKESYSGLSNKVLKSFIKIDTKYKYSYVLKCDDDSFVLLDFIVETLIHWKTDKNYYWGKMIEDAEVFTDGKFAEKRWSLGKNYIPYAIGAGYVLSGNLVGLIVRNSKNLMLYHNEDVSVSMWIAPYEVERQHSHNVCENKPWMYYKCARAAVVLHPVKTSQDMVQLQQLYERRKSRC